MKYFLYYPDDCLDEFGSFNEAIEEAKYILGTKEIFPDQIRLIKGKEYELKIIVEEKK